LREQNKKLQTKNEEDEMRYPDVRKICAKREVEKEETEKANHKLKGMVQARFNGKLIQENLKSRNSK
jgi:hypothetical protein